MEALVTLRLPVRCAPEAIAGTVRPCHLPLLTLVADLSVEGIGATEEVPRATRPMTTSHLCPDLPMPLLGRPLLPVGAAVEAVDGPRADRHVHGNSVRNGAPVTVLPRQTVMPRTSSGPPLIAPPPTRVGGGDPPLASALRCHPFRSCSHDRPMLLGYLLLL